MVISVFPDYGQAIDRYRSVRNERLERQAQQAQQATFNRMLQGIEDPQQRAALETMGPQQGATAFVSMRQQEEAARAEAERERRAAVNEYGNSVATRLRVMQGQEGFDPETFLSEAYANGQSQYGMQMPFDQFARLVSNPMAGDMPEPGFEVVTRGGREMQLSPDGRYYAMPGASSAFERGMGTLAAALAAGDEAAQTPTRLPGEVDRAIAEERFGPGARARLDFDAQGDGELVEIGERPVDREREGIDFETDLAERRQRIAALEQRLEREQNQETRNQINQDLAEEMHQLRVRSLEQELQFAPNAERRAEIQSQIDIAENDRAQAEFDREASAAEREERRARRRERRDYFDSTARSSSLNRQMSGVLDRVFADPSIVGGREDQLNALIRPGDSQAGQVASELIPIQANVAFGELQKMREASPTGGALGNVSNFEGELLMNSRGELSIATNPEILTNNVLDLYEVTFYDVHGRPEDVREAVDRGVLSQSTYEDYLEAEYAHRQQVARYRNMHASRFGGVPTIEGN